MKEGFIIKLNWIVYKNEIIKNIPLLTAENPQKVYQNARHIYKQELKQMDEYGPGDVLKLNLVHGVMLYSIYAGCKEKPGVNELREFYRKVVLTPKLVRAIFARADATSAKSIQRQAEQAKKSQSAAHPYTWQYQITKTGNKRFTAEFSRCGIYDYFRSKGHPELVPAMCLMDYSFCEVQKHIFLRRETLATGGKVCDCTYISKDIASKEELQEYENDMRNEASRGGVRM